MKLPESFTKVTFSKILAGALFVLLPFLGFYLGRHYQKTYTSDRISSLKQKNLISAIPSITITPTLTVAPPKQLTIVRHDKTNEYTSKYYGFSFSYPNNWNLKGKEEEEYLLLDLLRSGNESSVAI